MKGENFISEPQPYQPYYEAKIIKFSIFNTFS